MNEILERKLCSKKHYTYLHRKADTNEVFYIGKGLRSRAWTNKSRSDWWTKTANKHGFLVEVCAHWDTEQEAFEHEMFLIKAFRSLGCNLINQTDGGDGVRGLKHSAKTIDLVRQNTIALWADPSYRERVKTAQASRWTQEARDLHSARLRDAWSDEVRAKHSEKLKVAYSTPERIAMQRARSPIVNNRDSIEGKRREALQAYWASADVWSDEAKAKRSEATKKGWLTRKGIKNADH